MDISKLFICFTVQSLTVICQSEVCFWPCLLVLCASWYFRVPFIHIRKFSVIWGLLIRFTFPYLQESYDMYVWSLDHVSQIWSIRVFLFFHFSFRHQLVLPSICLLPLIFILMSHKPAEAAHCIFPSAYWLFIFIFSVTHYSAPCIHSSCDCMLSRVAYVVSGKITHSDFIVGF